ncbi:hypothetical protein SD80_024565 [Scytonema tolypothrichoides VB-61278]|nr:hypothetical protein SD80_024565 [Scytonema tolypothrichoides VB-61278]
MKKNSAIGAILDSEGRNKELRLLTPERQTPNEGDPHQVLGTPDSFTVHCSLVKIALSVLKLGEFP